MKNPVSITAVSSISPLGKNAEEIWANYRSGKHFLSRKKIGESEWIIGELSAALNAEIENLRSENSKYRYLDRSVLMAILTGRNISNSNRKTGINIGSSRGATELFEKYHTEFIETGKTSGYSSPSTTLGNISSWVAQDLQLNGPDFSHSITCSTGMHSILNGIAWLESKMSQNFIVGGSEAALTPFTLAQMAAMKIYASSFSEFPSRALDMKKEKNSMVLAEASGLLQIELGEKKTAKAIIRGIGYGNEKLKHGASLSRKGKCLQKSMRMAISEIDKSEIDAIVLHAPGTIGGDASEVNAVTEIFGENLPAITSNKWIMGHSFAASGILSLEMAILMLEHQEFINVPFSEFQKKPKKLEKILVNSVGFGGNAVSILVSRN
ncbi:beta-ketoacyl synthase N-terminal-like domain-containing protein [Gramella sp. AN32]|uniref:Beta-ketoacyl synthase N-terminal-like domain-containing protein n=1 Tax=Christiangramia antarctica TaxID=2058158 RepID=A0ABW5X2A6_9FLAO|nr:beta-ketoacyl synthase N-terminal-like domain-containing protein [Gramella sp. AN32]MCM4155239.1 beta-ketoacyl synthase [Gramella sp. AN32]